MKLTDYVSVAQLQGFMRHVLTIAGGSLVTAGYVSNADWTTAAGGFAVVAGIVWSYLEKKVKIDEETTATPPAPPAA